MAKEQRNTTTMNLHIPIDVSMALSKRVCDLKQSGSDCTKQSLILSYAQRGLLMDKDGESMPVKDTGLNTNSNGVETR